MPDADEGDVMEVVDGDEMVVVEVDGDGDKTEEDEHGDETEEDDDGIEDDETPPLIPAETQTRNLVLSPVYQSAVG